MTEIAWKHLVHRNSHNFTKHQTFLKGKISVSFDTAIFCSCSSGDHNRTLCSTKAFKFLSLHLTLEGRSQHTLLLDDLTVRRYFAKDSGGNLVRLFIAEFIIDFLSKMAQGRGHLSYTQALPYNIIGESIVLIV